MEAQLTAAIERLGGTVKGAHPYKEELRQTKPADEARGLIELINEWVCSSGLEPRHRDTLIRLRVILKVDLSERSMELVAKAKTPTGMTRSGGS